MGTIQVLLDKVILVEISLNFHRKEKMLIEEIEHHKLRGITPGLWFCPHCNCPQSNSLKLKRPSNNLILITLDTSIRRNWKLVFIPSEKKNQRYERFSHLILIPKTEIEQILQKYGSKEVNGIKYENFREFMIDLLGVTDTKEDILNSFKLLNKGEECAKIERFE